MLSGPHIAIIDKLDILKHFGMSQLAIKPHYRRILEKKITPVFAKYDMEFRCEMVDTVPCQAICELSFHHVLYYHVQPQHKTKVRNWHNLMPNVATLKNAYRDRPNKNSRGGDDLQDSDEEDNSDNRKKVPQSFTFIRREGWPFVVFSMMLSLS